MLSSWCFKFFVILIKICGLQTFQYPGKKYKESKLGFFLYLLSFSSFLFFCGNYFLKLNELQYEIDSLMKKMGMLITFSFIITRISVLFVSLFTQKEMFKLFKNLEKFDEIVSQNFMLLISNKNLCWSVIGLTAKFFGFCYIFGLSDLVFVLLYMTIYLPVDFYFLIVLIINNEIEVVSKLVRYEIFLKPSLLNFTK